MHDLRLAAELQAALLHELLAQSLVSRPLGDAAADHEHPMADLLAAPADRALRAAERQEDEPELEVESHGPHSSDLYSPQRG